MAIRSCVFALVVLAVVSQTHAQTTCNTTLLQAVQGTPQLSLLAQVINASGLADTVSMLDNVTVLAPDNNAFNGTGGLLPLLAENNLTLAQVTAPGSNRAASILLYHIIPVPAFAANLSNGQVLPTFLGADYTLTVSKTTGVTIVGAANNATVTVPDVRVCNSVVHIVNRVLLPASALTAIPVANSTAGAPGSPPSVDVPSPPGTNTSAASSLTTGSLAFYGLSGAVAAALFM